MKVVLDTNVFISGLLLPKSKSGLILQAWYQAKFELALSRPTLSEIERVLNYPKIFKRLQWDVSKIKHYLSLLAFFADIIDITGHNVIFEEDPNDTHLIATLIASRANYLVTGDSALLAAKDAYSILSVEEFLKEILP